METEDLTGIPGIDMQELRLRGFRVHKLAASEDLPVRRGRRDFYKMGLVNGDMTILYGGRLLELKGTVLFFVNPKIPHSIVRRINRISGYACIFTENFVNSRELQGSPLFSAGDSPVIPLTAEQAEFMSGVFQKMTAVFGGDYPYKADLIRNYIAIVIHEALRIQPPGAHAGSPFKNGAARISHLFFDLLERQFPIEQSHEPLRLRTAQDFASALSVHVNYLNRAVKEVTGRPTSSHIAGRIIAEAKALLRHTEWSVAEIAYALGFEYPAYFNNYFKRLTGTSPNAFRKV